MTRKYLTIYEDGISYWYLVNVCRPHKVRYHPDTLKKEKSYKKIENLKRSRIKQYCRDEYHIR